jgi:UDP:flavonoid glycosyltransferase YjiC (YdhE family)
VVAGPRIDPRSIAGSAHPGLEIRPYVDRLYRHLAACDVAIVQGGLTTTMELTANRRPFLYFPLRHHFEQCFHVHHRLQRYRAGTRMEFEQTSPEQLAAALVEALRRGSDTRPVEANGAARAAKEIAALL